MIKSLLNIISYPVYNNMEKINRQFTMPPAPSVLEISNFVKKNTVAQSENRMIMNFRF